MMNDKPKVSVIINTHNRAYHLKRLLDCLTRQTYDEFEVIVVNGPSTDHTEQVLKDYGEAIRVETCPEVNLCMSRNIGVRAAAGEIVAFIDDDAVPGGPAWLEELCKPFRDRTVGAVGGQSYRMNGLHEFSRGTFTIWAGGKSVNIKSLPPQKKTAEEFNGVIGCNCAFRRSAVVEAGGFDEYYTYFLDETDLCYRIAMLGYQIAHSDAALVYHEAAGGANRKSQYHLNWRVIARSRGYYVMKATEDRGLTVEERRKGAMDACGLLGTEFDWMLSEKKITRSDYKQFNKDMEEGRDEGIAAGLSDERKLIWDIAVRNNAFKRFDKSVANDHLNICYYCEDDPLHPIGGTAVHTTALCYGFIKKGHNVYIITRGKEETISNVNGINCCYVVPEDLQIPELLGLPNSNAKLNFSYACFAKLQQLKKYFYVDVVESPIWDSYGLVTTYLERDVPLTVRLQTPMKMWLKTFQEEATSDIEMLVEYESAMLDYADHIIAVSDCVKETIEELYEMKFKQPVTKDYDGLDPTRKAEPQREKDDGKLIVFFVGRLERRKGIDSILAAAPTLLEKYPDLELHLAGDCEIVDDVIGDTYKHWFLKKNRGAKWLRRVRFMGRISDEQKEQEFADCDVFVSPSLYESFGLIFVEAMRYGKPVIGCNAGGMREVIEDGVTGLLCEPEDPASFEQCLDRLLSDPDLRVSMGKAGLERMHRMFTDTVMCEQCEKIYREAIRNYRKA